MDWQSLINVAIVVKDSVETVAQIKDTVQNAPKLAEVGFVEFIKMKYGVIVTEKNIEQLFHITKKIAMTNQIQTKDFLTKVLQKHKYGDIEISMATLRVIEYMEDELLEAIISAESHIKPAPDDDSQLFVIPEEMQCINILQDNALYHSAARFGKCYTISKVYIEILELIKLTEC